MTILLGFGSLLWLYLLGIVEYCNASLKREENSISHTGMAQEVTFL